MAAVRAQTRDTIMDLDHTMRDESILDSGDDSDVMDNIVFRRPVTRGSLKAAALAPTPVASTSAQPARRRSPRKSTNMSPPGPPPRSRRISQTASSPSPSSSQSHSQPLPLSQSEPQVINDEPTGMSQDLASVSVADPVSDVPDVRMDTAEPQSGDSVRVPAPALMDTDAQLDPKDRNTDAKELGARTLGSRSAALVFETETEAGSQAPRDKPSAASSRTPLALPVFTFTASLDEISPEEPSQASLAISDLGLGPGSQTIDSTSSIENTSTDYDISIPAPPLLSDKTLAPPLTYTPRRSPRLSGSSTSTFVSTVSSTCPPHTVQTSVSSKVIVTPTAAPSGGASSAHPPLPVRATRQTKKGRAKGPARELGDGPSGTSHDAPVLDPSIISTNTAASSKGKEKELPPSPVLIPRIKSDTLLKPPKLRSLSPDSDAVLTSLHQTLTPQPRPMLRHLPKSSDRPPPPPSAMKRRAEEQEPASPEKRARFDPDPPPPTQPPAPLKQPPLHHARPARIRVHPSNSLVGMAHQVQQAGSSFVGAHQPIVVRPSGSPSRQQLLLQRNPGPPMRVPVGQPQRVVFPARVPSPVRTGSTNGMGMGSGLSNNSIRHTSPIKPQRTLNAKLGIWGPPAAIAPTHLPVPNQGAQSSQIKNDVLIVPRDGGSTRAPADGSSSPARTGRSRLPVLKASSGVLRATGEKAKGGKADAGGGDDTNESGLPPAENGVSVESAQIAGATRPTGENAGGDAGTLQVPGSVSRERTPPTPLETPASPGSSSSTLIMEVPLFYQPPTPRLPPIQQRTAEEIIAEGTAREAQRKRERQAQAQTPSNTAAAAAAALRCLPLSRARRIIPDGSSLQSWPSASGLTETQKELQRITQANTERNTAYACTLERTEAYKDTPRPPSPTSRIRTKAQKAKEVERQSRDERALRRSASRLGGDPDMSAVTADTSEAATSEAGPVLAPGDEEEWTSPGRPGRHVRWGRALEGVDAGAGAGSEPSGVGRGCLARTYELDRHGNARNVSQAAVEAERVVVVRYVYNDEAGFKGRKKR